MNWIIKSLNWIIVLLNKKGLSCSKLSQYSTSILDWGLPIKTYSFCFLCVALFCLLHRCTGKWLTGFTRDYIHLILDLGRQKIIWRKKIIELLKCWIELLINKIIKLLSWIIKELNNQDIKFLVHRIIELIDNWIIESFNYLFF